MSAPDGGCAALPGLSGLFDDIAAVAAARSGRTKHVRGVTWNVKRASKRHLAVLAAENPVHDYDRPQSFGECLEAERGTRQNPCPFVSCKHHLALEVNPRIGSVKIAHPLTEIEDLPATCALRVADEGGVTLEVTAGILGLTRERVRQIEYAALAKIRAAMLREGLALDDLTAEAAEQTFPNADWTRE